MFIQNWYKFILGFTVYHVHRYFGSLEIRGVVVRPICPVKRLLVTYDIWTPTIPTGIDSGTFRGRVRNASFWFIYSPLLFIFWKRTQLVAMTTQNAGIHLMYNYCYLDEIVKRILNLVFLIPEGVVFTQYKWVSDFG